MTWTAVVDETRPQGTAFVSFVWLSDGVNKSREQFGPHSGSLADLRQLVLAFIAASETRPVKLAAVAPGTVIDCTPDLVPVTKQPTQAEVQADADRAQFESDASLLASLQRGVTSGVITPLDASYKNYTDLRDSVRTRYAAHPEYAGLL